ncbi:EamA family transporter [Sneathiella sp. P13V-1]|uniref:DMT family transporter n=1 Tax=Sneathiella sp. P13V-1 TaxID=2697366 RepID=UPI00187B3059|nr:EamA family transporter [Sneathiella sp. P13V-1]MBE7636099.1 EamA family transporter [Sneathiella sp. P13V-1]
MSNKVETVDYLVLVALSVMFSSSFMFIKIAIETLTPLMVASGRLMIAMVLLYVFMKFRGESLPMDRRSWLFFIAIGIVGNAFPFFIISWAEQTVDSSVAGILIATIPLISYVVGHFATQDEKLTPLKMLGLLVGFGGIIVLIGPAALLNLGDNVVSQLAVILGGCGYVAASFIGRAMPPMSPTVRATGVLITATIIAVPICLIVDNPWTASPSLASIGAVVMLGIFPTAIATILLFFIIIRAGATFLALNNYLNPVFAIILGFVFLAEVPEAKTYLGLLLILGGVVITQLPQKAKAQPAKT